MFTLARFAGRRSCSRWGSPPAIRPGQPGQQFVTDIVWIANPEIHWHVGIDGLSLWLIILSTFLTPIAILISWRSIKDRVKEFFAFLLLLEFGLVGVFAAWDLFLFYVFWEVVLVPMYFLIGIWGHDRRIYAAVKFFLYTLAGSVLMLVAIIFIYNRAGHVRLRGHSRAARQRQDHAVARAKRRCCSSRSSSPSRSKFRSSRCTPGCPTRTWKRPRPDR